MIQWLKLSIISLSTSEKENYIIKGCGRAKVLSKTLRSTILQMAEGSCIYIYLSPNLRASLHHSRDATISHMCKYTEWCVYSCTFML